MSRTIFTGGQSNKVVHCLYGGSSGLDGFGGGSASKTAARAGLALMRCNVACERPKRALL